MIFQKRKSSVPAPCTQLLLPHCWSPSQCTPLCPHFSPLYPSLYQPTVPIFFPVPPAGQASSSLRDCTAGLRFLWEDLGGLHQSTFHFQSAPLPSPFFSTSPFTCFLCLAAIVLFVPFLASSLCPSLECRLLEDRNCVGLIHSSMPRGQQRRLSKYVLNK